MYDSYAAASGLKLGWQVLAGTSASAPFIAGVHAAAGHLAGVHGPNTLYQQPRVLIHGVTSGSDGEAGDCVSVDSVLSRTRRSRTGCVSRSRAGTASTDPRIPHALLGF